MLTSLIYDPAADCFARVIRSPGGWKAQCYGRYRPAHDERAAVEAADQMLDQRAPELKRSPAR